ncbi:MAG TPA: TonB-dependent receptor, partial [Vicinamibacterales bacterium]|nr:TonB-dependent receptor [Vicinamibacterales bacterium]
QPKGQIVVSDQQGQFTIAGVTPGQYTISISYVGLLPFTETLTVSAGEVARVDAVLQVAGVKEEVTVSAARPRGEAQALNRTRTADNIVQVLPAEVITSLPNTNIADAVGRLPSVSLERDEGEGKYVQIRGTDPHLSNVTINGINVPSPEGGVRNVKLDVIPSDLVASIEVNKTLSANQDGDAIGGSVNLVTKTAGDETYVTASALGGYTNIVGGRGLDQFTSTVGTRFGEGKRGGVLVGGSYDWNGRGINDVEPSQGTNDFGSGPVPVVTSADIREYVYRRARYGFAGGLDYRLGAGSAAYVKGLFSQFNDYGTTWLYTPNVGNFITPSLSDNSGNMTSRTYDRQTNQQIWSMTGGAKHNLGTSLLEYDLAVSRSGENGNFPTASFNGPGGVAFGIDTSDPLVPRFPVLNGVNIYVPSTYTLTSWQAPANDPTAQRNIEGALSLIRPYTTGSHVGSFDAGVKIRDADKTRTVNDQYYDPTGSPVLSLSAVPGGPTDPNYYFGYYTMGPLPDYNKIAGFLSANPSAIALNVDTTHQRDDSNNYHTRERVYAFYAMNTIDFSSSHLQAGVRVEATQSSYTGYHVSLDANGHYLSTSPIGADHNYTNVLPSVQYRFAIDANTNIRAVYGMGIARPNFGDIPPYILQQDRRKTISVGNPTLQPTKANDFDLLFERFLEPLGVIQAGVFYKALTDPIYPSVQTTVTSGTYAGYTQQQATNGPSAHVAGVEMTWQQHLSFLPAPANGLGFLANYSYTSSKASVPGRTDDPALLRQAPNNWNLSVTYDKRAFSGRLGVTHNDANIFAYNYQQGADGGITGPNGDVYLYAHTQLDAQASYSLARSVQVVVSLLNLNNEVFGFYQGSPQYPIQREFYNRTYSFGVRLQR